MKLILPTEYKVVSCSIEDLSPYYKPKVIRAYCKDCPMHQKVWSCPPLSFEEQTYLSPYGKVYLIGIKAFLPKTAFHSSLPEDLSTTVQQLYEGVRKRSDAVMFSLEETFPKSLSLLGGRCLLCNACKRKENLPCIHPDKLRYSLEALGFSVTDVTTEFLKEEIQWSKNALPSYISCISALLSKEALSLDVLKKTIETVIEPLTSYDLPS